MCVNIDVGCDRCLCIECDVPQVDLCVGHGRAFVAVVVAGDDAHRACVAGEIDVSDLFGGQRLIAGRVHLVVGGQVDPELRHLESAAGTGPIGVVVLLVQDPGGGGHPLHVAGADDAAGAGAVVVGDAAVEGERDGFEPTVGMHADAARCRGRRVV